MQNPVVVDAEELQNSDFSYPAVKLTEEKNRKVLTFKKLL